MFHGFYHLLKVLFPCGLSSPTQLPLPHPGHQGSLLLLSLPLLHPTHLSSTQVARAIIPWLKNSVVSHSAWEQHSLPSCAGLLWPYLPLPHHLQCTLNHLPFPRAPGAFPPPLGPLFFLISTRVALQSFQDSTNAASSLKPSLTTFLPEGSELTLSPLSSQRFCIKGLEDILFLPLSTPVVSSQGAKTSLSSLSAKPHPLLLPPLWRQRLPLGEGSCLEISSILLTAQSRRRKRPRRLRSAGGVLTRRPSAGPEPRSVCRSARVCGWGRGTWQPPGLVAICSCSISLMSLFRIPRALLTGQRGGVQKTQRRSRASPLLLGET